MTFVPEQINLGMGGHHSAKMGTDEWLTPPEILRALGPFDLDPCAPVDRPWDTATKHYTVLDNGLIKPWGGRVWLNPPYGPPAVIAPWMRRMAQHGNGIALIFARTETEMFFETVWQRASALLFIRGRLNFHFVDGRRAANNAGAPSVLAAYHFHDAEALASSGIVGKFVPLIIPRSVIACFVGTWREAIEAAFPAGDFSLDDLYRVFAAHPKAQGNAHVKEKLRQTLARGGFERVGRGRYARASA